MDEAHALAAPARDRLDDERIADRLGNGTDFIETVDDTVTSGDDRYAGILHRLACLRLVAHP